MIAEVLKPGSRALHVNPIVHWSLVLWDDMRSDPAWYVRFGLLMLLIAALAWVLIRILTEKPTHRRGFPITAHAPVEPRSMH